MTRRGFRLRRSEIKAVFATKAVFGTAWFTVRWRDNDDLGARVGFAFSRRDGGAVVRNRWKRRWRELTRRNLKEENVDLVILVRRPLKTLADAAWRVEAQKIVRRCEERRRR